MRNVLLMAKEKVTISWSEEERNKAQHLSSSFYLFKTFFLRFHYFKTFVLREGEAQQFQDRGGYNGGRGFDLLVHCFGNGKNLFQVVGARAILSEVLREK